MNDMPALDGLHPALQALLKSECAGMARGVGLRSDPSMPGWMRYALWPTQGSWHVRNGTRPVLYLGVARSMAHAVGAALGEFVERECALSIDAEQWRRSSATELGLPLAQLNVWNGFDRRQYRTPGFPFVPLDGHSARPWCRVAISHTGDSTWIPADRVGLEPMSAPTAPPGSNGLAAGTDPDRTLVRAILELIERDAIMRAWLSRAGWTRLLLPPALHAEIACLLRAERQYRFFTVPGLAGHTVVCFSQHEKPAQVVASSACEGSLHDALVHALREHAQCLWALESEAHHPPDRALGGRDAHRARWACRAHRGDLHWLPATSTRPLELDPWQRHDPTVASSTALMRALYNQGHPIYWINLHLLAHAPHGLCVRRVVAPSLVPLYFGARGIPRALLRRRKCVVHNALPHPFT